MIEQMISNIIKLGFGSFLFLFIVACVNKPKSKDNIVSNKKILKDCRYYAYDAQQIVSNLGCYNCHVRTNERLFEIPTFSEISIIDSLKLLKYTFTKKHKGWYDKSGTFKKSRMDTLSDCEVKSVIRYIKDYNRDTPPMPNH